MKVIHTIAEVRDAVQEARSKGHSIGLVPTMGYFHEGHLSLMHQARRDNGFVVVSLFVNPTQFGPSEDLAAYPRDLGRDAAFAESMGVDVIFNPDADDMYPHGYSTYVEVENLTKGLCGASRPGHFKGVTTVVLKLFNIVQPERAYFGEKDYQQLTVIRRMVRDLNVPVDIVGMPIVRESDGLAKSSRNTYLSADERQAALILSKSLNYAQELVDQGILSAVDIRARVGEFIEREPLATIDYVSLVDPNTLDELQEISTEAVLAEAVRIGKTRLIDNRLLKRSR